ncbi:hypothetical protein HZ326_25908 [Fusarium oxysporum f. sp. albedinis]|nr:hypothetical protein HZ326_25908 [Fusarium oxysporum f. sp. albedinis]
MPLNRAPAIRLYMSCCVAIVSVFCHMNVLISLGAIPALARPWYLGLVHGYVVRIGCQNGAAESRYFYLYSLSPVQRTRSLLFELSSCVDVLSKRSDGYGNDHTSHSLDTISSECNKTRHSKRRERDR